MGCSAKIKGKCPIMANSIQKLHMISLEEEACCDEEAEWASLWKGKIPPKLKHCFWLARQDRLLKKKVHLTRHLTTDCSCKSCGFPTHSGLGGDESRTAKLYGAFFLVFRPPLFGVRRRELIGSKSSPERGAVASATSAGEGELDCTVCFGTATC